MDPAGPCNSGDQRRPAPAAHALASGLQINCLTACPRVPVSPRARLGLRPGRRGAEGGPESAIGKPRSHLIIFQHANRDHPRPHHWVAVPCRTPDMVHARPAARPSRKGTRGHPPGGCHTTTARKLSLGTHSERSAGKGDLAATYAENLPGMPSEVSTHRVDDRDPEFHACHRPPPQIA